MSSSPESHDSEITINSRTGRPYSKSQVYRLSHPEKRDGQNLYYKQMYHNIYKERYGQAHLCTACDTMVKGYSWRRHVTTKKHLRNEEKQNQMNTDKKYRQEMS